jgi:hypothetical protein
MVVEVEPADDRVQLVDAAAHGWEIPRGRLWLGVLGA